MSASNPCSVLQSLVSAVVRGLRVVGWRLGGSTGGYGFELSIIFVLFSKVSAV